ncbi:DUF2795 domain-containing protein [Micromonospora sp. LZ34]
MVNQIELEEHLGGLYDPVDKPAIKQRARDDGATDEVVRALDDLPANTFDSPEHVGEAFGRK